jgi:hypothetical protein
MIVPRRAEATLVGQARLFLGWEAVRGIVPHVNDLATRVFSSLIQISR